MQEMRTSRGVCVCVCVYAHVRAPTPGGLPPEGH